MYNFIWHISFFLTKHYPLKNYGVCTVVNLYLLQCVLAHRILKLYLLLFFDISTGTFYCSSYFLCVSILAEVCTCTGVSCQRELVCNRVQFNFNLLGIVNDLMSYKLYWALISLMLRMQTRTPFFPELFGGK